MSKVQIVVTSRVHSDAINKSYFTIDDNTKAIGDVIHTIITSGLAVPCDPMSELNPKIGNIDLLAENLRKGGYTYIFPAAIVSIDIVKKF